MSLDCQTCRECGHVKEQHVAQIEGQEESCKVNKCSCPRYVEAGSGELTCPRRAEGGPWSQAGLLDYWSTSHWGPYYNARWPEAFERPRVCSFCGGVNPDDAIKLIEAGWEVEATGKAYKRYLNPPGFAKHQVALIEAVRTQAVMPQPEHQHPTPPVKVYTMHFNQAQVDKFNAVLAARKQR